jgi:hypothetical protein
VRSAKLGPPIAQDDEGTVSPLESDGGFKCLVLELPDRANANGHSRIPAGTYPCEWAESPHHGPCYHVRDVPGRSDILIHAGNLAGDVDMGFASDLLGCLAPGTSRALFRAGEAVGRHTLTRDQHGVASSGVALKALVEEFHHEPFMLTITR